MLLSFLGQRSQATEEVALKLQTLRPRHLAAKLSEERRQQVKLKKTKHHLIMGKSASKQFAEEVLKAHNDYRKKHGVPPLKLCKKLNRGAQQYAEELATTRVLKHSSESANGKCGENLAWASYDQPGLNVLLRKLSYILFCSVKHFYRIIQSTRMRKLVLQIKLFSCLGLVFISVELVHSSSFSHIVPFG
ncbi:Golgi-associated plant pathogenesis-related protein 1 isoform X2 [Ciconia boyciana]|uniref:Golgi-associated plant pathogenesis-related protein 1 isoform X2 n=1 Tax=Ciconia boyciana TaxID=52775 RepID=UPI003B9DEB06